ncbi:MAG: glutamine-hydrolyzing GMP synthase [Planctomycetaceae bacterium]|nr:glutamine-hydrolyzing GMP synthase [Planctomycetaceae bacterium]
MSTQHETILVLNFGTQYLQLIARRVRECHVYSKIVPHTVTAEEIRRMSPKGIIFSGGPSSVYAADAYQCDPEIFRLGIPILGICYGMHLMMASFGGHVRAAAEREYGRAVLSLNEAGRQSPLFRDIPASHQVWMSHGDHTSEISEEFQLLASSETCPVCAAVHRKEPFYGVQFHPEVMHSVYGTAVLRNFLKEICGCSFDWTMRGYAEQMVRVLRGRIGSEHVICGLSGGVDSSVVAAILARAIGPQLSCILVDNGLMRKGEVESVEREFTGHFQIDLHIVRAADRFLALLEGVTDPQEKRKRIGHEFINAFSSEAARIRNVKYLAQGTIYPDVIESGGHDVPSATIKLHHNVGGLPENLEFELIEPLRDLFKDEVRLLGRELGLPDSLVWRHPFPGPGLAVRCLGEVTPERLAVLREADAVLLEEIALAGLQRAISQAFVVLLPVQSVGVMGDCRTYENAAAVRCVTTEDFMTADWTAVPDPVLRKISTRIINEVKGINRVVYDISSKPPATIEWE